MKKIIEFLISLFKRKRTITPSPTPTPLREPKCYLYHFQNESDEDVDLDVIDCYGNRFFITIKKRSSGNTLCLKTLSEDLIRNYEEKKVKLMPDNVPCGY
jgi:hypothetical protein